MARTYTLGLYIPGSTVGGTTGSNTISDSALSGAVTSILGFDSTAAADKANATAEAASAKGYQTEAGLYSDVSKIDVSNSNLAQASGDVKSYQDQLKALTTIGEQKAAVASNGFREAGSNLDILRSSLQQSYLTKQLDLTQTNINVGGYLEASTGALAENAAATAAADSATALGKSYTDASTTATTNAANETAALNTYLGKAPLTTAQSLIVSPLGSAVTDTNIATTGTKVGVGNIGTTKTAAGSTSNATTVSTTVTGASSSTPVFEGSETTGALSTTFGI